MSTLMRFFKPHFLACFLLALPLWAQQDSGGLVVSVRDPNGASVPVAKVVVTNVDTNQKFAGTTNDTGDFTVSPLRPGRYKATVQREGFQTAVSEANRRGRTADPPARYPLGGRQHYRIGDGGGYSLPPANGGRLQTEHHRRSHQERTAGTRS